MTIAQKSSEDLWEKFFEFYEAGDFVGMDMERKFIQIGMTRAKRYANHRGGRKYEVVWGERRAVERTRGHVGMEKVSRPLDGVFMRVLYLGFAFVR